MRLIKRQVLGLELLRQIGQHGQRIFSLEQLLPLAKEIGLSEKELPSTLKHLQHDGWIVPIRRGLYAIWCSLPTSPAAHPFEIGLALTKPSVISYWTALNQHNLVKSASPYIYVLTRTGSIFPRLRRKDTPHPPGTYPIGDLLFFFVQTKLNRAYGVEHTSIEGIDILITDLERTLVEAVALPQHCGGWQNVQEAFHHAHKKLDITRLVTYATQSDVATAKRIGWLLEQSHTNSALLQPLLDIPIKGYRRLDSSSPPQGKYSKKWLLQINS